MCEPRFDMHHAVGYAMNRPVGLTVEICDLSFWIDDDVTGDRSHGLMRSYSVRYSGVGAWKMEMEMQCLVQHKWFASAKAMDDEKGKR